MPPPSLPLRACSASVTIVVMVSEIFDADRWRPVDGFDFTDITYHRAVDSGTVRVAFDRPEVRKVAIASLFTDPAFLTA